MRYNIDNEVLTNQARLKRAIFLIYQFLFEIFILQSTLKVKRKKNKQTKNKTKQKQKNDGRFAKICGMPLLKPSSSFWPPSLVCRAQHCLFLF